MVNRIRRKPRRLIGEIGGYMATIKEIAQKVGVTSAVVSRVLNYDKTISVSEETRNAIFQVAKELNYQKKKIYPPINNVVILNWADEEEELENEFYRELSKEMERQALERNMQIVQIKKTQGIEAVPEQTQVFIGIGRFLVKEVQALKKITLQGIFIDSSPDENTYDSVRPNLDLVVSQIVTYFVQKGHRAIGFIGVHDMDINTQEPLMDIREWTFRNTMAYHHILDEKNIFIVDHLTVKEGYRIGQICAEREDEELPTAFCIGSDTLAVGFLQAMNENGIVMPERVAVFSINDTSIAEYISPPLSTYHIDIPIMCETALDLLHERMIKNRDITKTVYINGKPIMRKSC